MVDMSKYMGSQFWKVADVKESGPFQAKIADVEINEKFDKPKPEVHLDDGSILSLNATNVGRLVRAYGANSDDWIGKEIELSIGEVDYQDKAVETILVKPISPPIENKAPAKPKRRDELNDEIPF
jgi:hypothetical protein